MADDNEVDVYLVLDREDVYIGTLSSLTGDRTRTTFPVNRWGRIAGVRFVGNVTRRLSIYGAELDVHVPQESLR